MSATAQFLPPTISSPENFSILVVSPHHDDHASLLRILQNETCKVTRAGDVGEAMTCLKNNAPSLVISERDLPDGTWRDVLSGAEESPKSPLVLVVSRQADESLWGEVLNLGGYDVLMKPFDVSEVTRVAAMALRQWFQPSQPHMTPQVA